MPLSPQGGDIGRLFVAAIESVAPSGQRLPVVLVCDWSVCGVVLVLMLIYYSLILFLCLFYMFQLFVLFFVLLAAICLAPVPVVMIKISLLSFIADHFYIK